MARPSKFAHVVYSTRRFDEMIDWYQRVFEATVVYQYPWFAFLTYDDENHRFAFANLSVLTPGSRASEKRDNAGVNHVAYTYSNLGDLLGTYERLKEMLCGGSRRRARGVIFGGKSQLSKIGYK